MTSVGDSAFADCADLADISFPSTLTKFGDGVFDRTKWRQNYPSDFIAANGILIDYKGAQGDVTVPGTIHTIGSTAFDSDLGLTHVTLSEGVEEVDDNAFDRDYNLTGVALPESLTKIGSSAFAETGLTSVTLPSHLTSLGGSAFSGCTSLQSISIPASLQQLSGGIFYNCTALKNVQLAKGLKGIGTYAFENCSSLDSITLPDGLETIGEGTFEGCTISQSITLPNSVTSLGKSAFSSCAILTSVGLSSGLTSINTWTFLDDLSLNTIVIPNGVKRLEYCAFLRCGVQNVTIPASVIYIDADAFNGITSLTITGYDNTAAQTFAAAHKYRFLSLGPVLSPAKSFSLDTTGTYNFGQGNTYTYLVKTSSSTVPTAYSSNPVAVSVSYLQKTTGGYLFRVTRLAEGNAVITTRIGNEGASFTAVAGPSVRSDSTIPFTLKEGASYTFKIIVLTNSTATPQFSVEYDYAFKAQLVNKSGHDFYYKITAIGHTGDSSLVYAKLPGEDSISCAVTIAPTNDFIIDNQGVLKKYNGLGGDVIIPKGVTAIGSQAFEDTPVRTVAIPSTVTIIGDHAFDFSKLQSITIPATVTSIGPFALGYCDNLTQVTLPKI